jgi:integrase
MERAGTPTSARIRAWKVLSSILSYAAAEETIPEIRTNGSLLVAERTGTKRRSSRRGGTGQGRSRTTRANRRVGAATRNWALSPMAVELIRHYQLRRTDQRPEILPKRDALVTSLQYGLCLRDQEVFALRWRSVDSADLDDPDLVVIDEVLSWNQLDEGKTSGSVRETHCPELLRDDLNAWRRFLRQSGFRTRANDFIVPGDLGGSYRGKPIGIPDEESGGYHFSSNMVKKWHQKFFAPAVEQASASDAKYADILGATPYSLRRGGISLRLRTEDAQTVADECGTSLQMLDKHYAFSLKDMDRLNRLPMDDEWRAARASVEGNFKTPPRLRVVA